MSLFCTDCQKAVCPRCAIGHHKSHDVTSIEEVYEHIKVSVVIAMVIAMVTIVSNMVIAMVTIVSNMIIVMVTILPNMVTVMVTIVSNMVIVMVIVMVTTAQYCFLG